MNRFTIAKRYSNLRTGALDSAKPYWVVQDNTREPWCQNVSLRSTEAGAQQEADELNKKHEVAND